VSASAKNGSPITPEPSTLSAAIDKQPVQITSVHSAKDGKLLFAVMVDISSFQKPKEAALKDAALKIFQGLTNEQSQGYLVLFDMHTYPSKRPLQPSEVQAALNHIGFGGGTALYDGITQISSGILSRRQNPDISRRVLVVLSDGDDNYSHILADKMEEAEQREGVSNFSLSEYRADGSGKGLDSLKQFAKDTGGTAVLENKMADGVAALIASVQSQSVLSVAPVPSSARLRSLSIKTQEKGVSIAAPAHILIP
jgi:Ca-activated chloride channel homolog